MLAYTHKVALPDSGRKTLAVDRMRALLGPLGVDTVRAARFDVAVDAAATARITQTLGVGAAAPAVVIPGARWETKRWAAEGYVEVINRLHAAGIPVALAGTPNERALCETIAAACAAAPQNLAGRTDLAELMALLAQARIVISNDSGPLHVAVALKRPIVALYGPTDPAFVGPYGQLDHVVRFDVPCFPCRLRTCDHHSCMRGVTADAVWTKVQEVMHAAAGITQG